MLRNLDYLGWLFFIIFLILLIPNYTNSYHQVAVEEVLKEKKRHLMAIKNLTLGIQANITNVDTTVPDTILEKKRSLFSKGIGEKESLYHNITGYVHGEWHKFLTHSNSTLIPKYAKRFEKLLSYNKGLLSIFFEESILNGNRITDATLSIQDEAGNLYENISLKGIHFEDNGSMILTSSSYKFPSLITIPLFAFNNFIFQKSLILITQILEQQIKQLQNSISKNKKIQIHNDSNNEYCEFVVYLQLLPIHNNKEPKLREIEKDLQMPNGLPYSLIPPIILSGIIMSPDCKFSLDFNNITGIKKEKYYSDINKIAFWQNLLIIIQIYLLIKQMNETSTPSSISRISFWSIWIQASLDGYSCIIFLSTSISHNSIFLSSITTSFLSFTLVAIFGMRYLLIIHRIQQPETRITTIERPSHETNEETIPLNQQEHIHQTNRTQQSEYNNSNNISAIYTQFYLFLLVVVLIFPQIMLLPANKRQYIVYTITFIAFSFWWPQIIRNSLKGYRKPFLWSYVIGMSITRIIPIIYLFSYQKNILFIPANLYIAWGVFGWLWFQICILASQDFFGPRFFIPSNLLHPTYDYHPILFEDAETPLSYSNSNGRIICSICIQNISLPRINKNSTTNSTSMVLARRTYMVTPCKHLFHTNCLEKWMKIRLICPGMNSL
ncbi:ubiquitin-protein ligase TUL1 [Pneumocystis jirovecii RU7]|uniref:RING-type E3 ubiquitin transferase n=1 Tax=Pneumocystis jirovecii (strain RU7) TaxID=1408657 RepID=A0A0W4ZNI2_PNEJ7|nr:ubiquitin-protein ligase TUL1 [Pneumocystis jirovecii RU7]KTW29931.1 hypothetical protein T551_01875 [Pneumocystis jirovecii RU7]